MIDGRVVDAGGCLIASREVFHSVTSVEAINELVGFLLATINGQDVVLE